MSSTGWKRPQKIAQYNGRELNKGACYLYSDLKDILKDTYNYAYIPLSGGIDSKHASPIIYAWNYNFNIPNNATITKIHVQPVLRQSTGRKYGKSLSKYKLLKLKTGTSVTDRGVGNNKAPTKNIKYIPNKKSWQTDTISGTPKEWGVPNINPSIINNTNFGMLIQVIGTEYKKWVDSQIAKLLINIEYTTPTSILTQNRELTTSEYKVNIQVNNSDLTKLDLNKKDTPIKLTIQTTHKGKGGQTPIITFKSTDLLISDKKLHTYTLPTLNVPTEAVTKVYTQYVNIYPGTLTGVQTVDITHNGKYDNITVNNSNKPPINFKVINSNTNSYTSITNSEKEKYSDKSQRCIITNSYFEGNGATKGGAIYIYKLKIIIYKIIHLKITKYIMSEYMGK